METYTPRGYTFPKKRGNKDYSHNRNWGCRNLARGGQALVPNKRPPFVPNKRPPPFGVRVTVITLRIHGPSPGQGRSIGKFGLIAPRVSSAIKLNETPTKHSISEVTSRRKKDSQTLKIPDKPKNRGSFFCTESIAFYVLI